MDTKTQVLVVGAGPVGLMTALHLKQRGVDVKVVDQAETGSAHSFAVVLHPCTVEMLAEFGLVDPLRWQGQSFNRMAVFTNGERVARLTLPVDGELANGGLTLPQDVLRSSLESALRTAGVEVEYQHTLAHLEQRGEDVRCRLSVAPHSTGERGGSKARSAESCVVSTFLIGADGFQSTVRERLGIASIQIGRRRSFAFFDVPQPTFAGATAELVIGDYSSAMYPLHAGNTRYCFELPSLPEHELRLKELRELQQERMPWHPTRLEAIEWSGVRSFQPAFAERFGYWRTWLVGDACHVANPIGAQSLNVGLREARELAHAIADCLKGGKLEHLSTGYAEQRRLEWRRLHAIGERSFGPRAPAWAVRYFEQLISCLPASRDDLDDLLEQLGISVL
ncbi:MAG TPA: NAD(P)/FAD-dependent oxidoreductase [Polyangiaceae bacterium]|nr:NAD(P)/FAD-dependent oxidoreductase [Polyangiaceae bacterium]